ncbi:MAG: hypothetical protein AAFO04_24765 [Cyanobacteria bacterium J06592_8]
MKFQTTIKIVFLTVVMSLSPLTPAHSVNSFSPVKDAVEYKSFQAKPPIEGNGGSRFSQPFTPSESSSSNKIDGIEQKTSTIFK